MFRVGQGWDVHRLVAGGPLRLGGVDVPFDHGLAGHSDGDVVLHAVADAVLGAMAAGDLGTHFPSSDPALVGIDSAVLLGKVVTLATERGMRVGNVDVTIIAERPKLGPHLSRIAERLTAILGVEDGRVSVKAKSAEGLGAIGRGEAIAALAIAAVESA